MNLLQVAKSGIKTAAICIDRYSPEILLTTSLLGIGATVYFTVKAVQDLTVITEDHENYVRDVSTNPDASDEEKAAMLEVVNKEYRKYRIKATIPAGVSIIATTASVCGLYGILSARVSRYAAVAASTAAAFTTYRNRNIEKYGEEADHYCMYGVEKEKITVKNGETGKKETVEREVIRKEDGDLASPFAVLFAPFDYDHRTGSRYWTTDSYYNSQMLTVHESGWVREYEAGHPIKLIDVYKTLGFDTEDMLENGLGRGIPKDAILKMGWWKGHEPAGSDGYFSLRLTKVVNKPDPGYGEEEENIVWIIDPNVPGILA